MRRTAALLAGAIVLAPAAAWAAPSDDYYSLQWGLKIIRAEAAWSKTRGGGVVVAVVDTGVDATHPDLAANVLPGRDYVDDDDDARDENGHGTMVAGIIGAVADNHHGIAGVAPRVRLLPVRVLDREGTGSSTDVARGIRWAVDQGAVVINLSLAQDPPPGTTGLPSDRLLRDPGVGRAIQDAAEAGAVVVVAAGNDRSGGRPQTAYDATTPGVVVVGASTTDDRLAAYSNHGPGLDLVAPGGGSPTVPGDGGCDGRNSIVTTWWDEAERESTIRGGCGTSMSVGFVSGVAAMLRARGLSNAEATERLLETADDLGANGRDDRFGHGRLNAARALGVSTKPKAARDPGLRVPVPTLPEKPDVAVQGDGDEVPAPAPEPTERDGSPPDDDPVAELDPPIAFPPVAVGEGKGWPVLLASALVSLLVLLHTVRFLLLPAAVPRRWD